MEAVWTQKMKTSSKWRRPKNEEDLKNEDDLKMKMTSKMKMTLKIKTNKYDLKIKDYLKNEGNKKVKKT